MKMKNFIPGGNCKQTDNLFTQYLIPLIHIQEQCLTEIR